VNRRSVNRRTDRARTIGVMRRLTLQGRFAVLAALAVALAVVGAAAIGYFLVAGQLNQQVDSELAARPQAVSASVQAGAPVLTGSASGTGPLTLADALAQCKTQQQVVRIQGAGQLEVQAAMAISTSAGVSCSLSPQIFDLGPTASPVQIAVAEGKQNDVIYDTYTTTGEHVRVRTDQFGGAGSGYAISSIVSLANMDNSLHSLAIGLSFASLGGILLAGAAGFLVARSALKPVRRLTKAAEHVAATDDLSVQLPVDGADELSRLGKAFNRMTRSLAASRERQQRLIADAGHELRTPLTALRTNIDVFRHSRRTGKALPPVDEDELLDSLDQQLHELSGLVTDLLELSRNTQGGRRRTMRVALHESIGRAVERARLRGPGLEFDVVIEPWFVQGDPTSLDRAVVNLLDNAVKFSPPGGRVTVRLSKGEYSVSDQGPGIGPADLPRVFERFYRADAARGLPGSGLGLAIVAQVAEETGGGIRLEPAQGGGTRARLTLPGQAEQGTRGQTTAARGSPGWVKIT
jgi:two-component system sensor histidine kinase MprB